MPGEARMTDHDDDHDHEHGHGHGHGHSIDDPAHPHNAPLTDVQLRVRALESLLTETDTPHSPN